MLFVVRWVVEKKEGNNFASGAHIIGRQAQIMAMFSSIMVHIEEVRSSKKKNYQHLRTQWRRNRHNKLTGCVRTFRGKVEGLHTDDTGYSDARDHQLATA